jgi:hypothetical protein
VKSGDLTTCWNKFKAQATICFDSVSVVNKIDVHITVTLPLATQKTCQQPGQAVIDTRDTGCGAKSSLPGRATPFS